MFKSSLLNAMEEYEAMVNGVKMSKEKAIKAIEDKMDTDIFYGYLRDEDFYENCDQEAFEEALRRQNKWEVKFDEFDSNNDKVERLCVAREKAHKEFCRKQCRML